MSRDEVRPPHDDDGAETLGVAPGQPTAADPSQEPAGKLVGRYRLIRPLGEGGFGTVYEAEQHEPVTRRVALKIIKLGMDTRDVIARFEAERQTLALMDHPHIARVLDAGATDTGRPFFVMELVAGVPITDYCDERQLGVRDRLALFAEVCQAVQHAHQKGIVHRDIKPSNVLVAEVDGAPVPKVIDFGIAKATSRAAVEQTAFTQEGHFVGTPEYMSPEQASPHAVDIDTRSDIYSLGVLLYALLVGTTPFEAKTLRSAGYAEIQRIIREVDPPRPSTRASALGASFTRVAGLRQERADRLLKQLRGELDWIVMKCLEKDRSRRYETANGLAMDIARYLADEPVSASPPSQAYRLRKLIVRNRAVFAAGTAMVLLLAAGVVGTSVGLVRARAAEATARAEAGKAATTAGFLGDMLAGVGPSVARGRDTALLEEILAETDRKVGAELAGQSEVEANIRSVLGKTYYDLGDFEKAREQFERSLGLYEQVSGGVSPDVASSHNSLALVYWGQADLPKAEHHVNLALDMRRSLFGDRHREVANSERDMANILVEQQRYAEAEEPLLAAIAVQREVLDPQHQDELATSLNSLGNVMMHLSRFEEAAPFFEEALAIHTRLLGHDHPFTVTDLHNLGWLASFQNDFHAAEARFGEAAAIARRIFSATHPRLAEGLSSHARSLQQLGRFDEAIALSREALAMTVDHFGADNLNTASAMANLAVVLSEVREVEETDRLNRQVLEIRRRHLGDTHPQTLSTMQNLAYGQYQRGDYAAAEAGFRESVAAFERAHGREHRETALVINNLGRTLRDAGKLDEAARLFTEAAAIRATVLGADHLMVTVSRHDLGVTLTGLRRLDEAAEVLAAVVAEYPVRVGPEHQVNAMVRRDLAQVELERDRPEQAIEVLVGARAIAVAAMREDDQLVVACDLLQAAALSRLGRIAAADSAFAAVMPRFAEAPAGRKAAASVHHGRHLAAAGRFAAAEAVLEPAFAQVNADLGADHPRAQDAVRALVFLYDRWAAQGSAGAATKAAVWRARLVRG